MHKLTEFYFEPLPDGIKYLTDKKDWFKNWLGLITSTILISLEDPIWFSTVRNRIRGTVIYRKTTPNILRLRTQRNKIS